MKKQSGCYNGKKPITYYGKKAYTVNSSLVRTKISINDPDYSNENLKGMYVTDKQRFPQPS
ncbi:hypothetical protein ACVW2L_003011 [Mucilaginibacter sp. HD30]